MGVGNFIIKHTNSYYCATHAHVHYLHKKGVKQLQFGAVLKKMRKGAGFSQEDMAERLHMSRSNVSRLESNKLELKAADLINWCKQTQAHDLLIAFIYNTDAVSAVQQLSQLITGTVLRFGGLI